MISSIPNQLPKALFLNTITLGFRALTYEFGEDTDVQFKLLTNQLRAENWEKHKILPWKISLCFLWWLLYVGWLFLSQAIKKLILIFE